MQLDYTNEYPYPLVIYLCYSCFT